MSESLFSPAKSLGALCRKYSGFVIEMWTADREEVTDLSKKEWEKNSDIYERDEKSCNNTRLSVYKPELNYGLGGLLVLSYVALYWLLG